MGLQSPIMISSEARIARRKPDSTSRIRNHACRVRNLRRHQLLLNFSISDSHESAYARAYGMHLGPHMFVDVFCQGLDQSDLFFTGS